MTRLKNEIIQSKSNLETCSLDWIRLLANPALSLGSGAQRFGKRIGLRGGGEEAKWGEEERRGRRGCKTFKLQSDRQDTQLS